jgi:energy-coupling factor transporter ATP-binding protein EcfA2
MKMSYAVAAIAATATVMLGACSENTDTSTTTAESPPASASTVDGTTTVAKGEGVALVGASGLGNQTLSVSADELDGKVTGEFLISDNLIRIDCADTDLDGIVILGGEATEGPDVTSGDLIALIIREGDPDSVSLYGNDAAAKSCRQLIDSIPDGSLDDDSNFVDVEDGYDIVTN